MNIRFAQNYAKIINFLPFLYFDLFLLILACFLIPRKIREMENNNQITKLYYSIGEVASMFKVNTSLIRFWEKEFDIIKPKKNKKGNRMFTQKDVDNFHLIYNLVKERGYTLKGAKEKLKKNPQDSLKEYEILKSLQNIESFLLDIKKHL